MQLNKVHISNFKCFKDLTIKLPPDNSLALLTGDNKQQAVLGSNGIGKTSFLDSICWALYGKTSKNKKASDLLNSNSSDKGYSVSLDFNNKKLIRSWNPNNLTLDGEEISQDNLDQLTKLTFDQFLQSVYFSQDKERSFIDLGPKDKLDFLSKIFELDKWIQCTDFSREQKKSVDVEILQNLNNLDIKVKQISMYETEKVQQGVLAFNFIQSQIEKSKELATKIQTIDNEINVLQSTVIQEINEETLSNTKDIIKELETQKKELEKAHKKCYLEHSLAKHEYDKSTKELANSDGVCPTCNQKINTEHFMKTKLEEYIKQQEIFTHQLTVALTDLELQINENEDLLTRTKELLSKKQTKFEEARRSKQDIVQKIENKNEMKSLLITKLQEVEKEDNPYDKRIKELNKEILLLSNITKQLKEDIEGLQYRADAFQFWINVFPKIRLKILTEVIDELEIHLNQNLTTLGLFDWSIKLVTERELVNETIKPELGLVLFINDKEVDIDLLSGGEKQRIRLIVSLGISSLIKSRAGVDINLLLIDEPCQALSEPGIEKVIELLKELAKTTRVIVAEHRILQLSEFDHVINLIKDKSGNTNIETKELVC